MSFELSGKIIEIFPENQVSDRFRKQEFVIEVNDSRSGYDFTDYIKFQLIQDKVDLIKSFKVNQEVTVSFNIKGNKWVKDGRTNYFTNLDAWKIEAKSNEPENPMPENFQGSPIENSPEQENDLPF